VPADAITGGRGGSRVVPILIRDLRLGDAASDPTGIGECDDGNWGDDEGSRPLLDEPILPRPCSRCSLPSRRCRSPMISLLSLRSRHLRC
jgi:hypothetical protein